MKLTRANVASLEQPLYTVWNAIGYDAYEAGGDLGTEEVIELCIDANRLSTFVDGEPGRAAEQLVTDLIKEHGYTKVLSFLAREFPMC